MSETLLRKPPRVPLLEAAHVAPLFANVAWNECVGLDSQEGTERVGNDRSRNPPVDEFKSNDHQRPD